MKKFITAILAVLYLSTSAGASVHLHYCMGELAEWSLSHSDSKNCGNCGMAKSANKDNGCCKDEQEFIKNGDDQKAVESFVIHFNVQAIDLPVHFPVNTDVPVFSISENYPVSNAPPRSSSVALHILNSTFLI
jgi:hypothetical protein